jgi:hypothetical protein
MGSSKGSCEYAVEITVHQAAEKLDVQENRKDSEEVGLGESWESARALTAPRGGVLFLRMTNEVERRRSDPFILIIVAVPRLCQCTRSKPSTDHLVC